MRVFVVKCDPCPGNEAGTVRINEEDYDKSKHTLICVEGEENPPELAGEKEETSQPKKSGRVVEAEGKSAGKSKA